MDKLFEQATREGLRFTTDRGNLMTEDLWKMPLTKLNALTSELYEATQKSTKKDFLNNTSSVEDKTAELRFKVAEYIITTRKAELDAKDALLAKKQFDAKIDSIIERKNEQSLENMSVEELMALKNKPTAAVS